MEHVPGLQALVQLGTKVPHMGFAERVSLSRDLESQVAAARHLSDADPAEGLPRLGALLVRHSVVLSELGRREAAFSAAKEAVGIYRALASADDRWYPDLASALIDCARVFESFEERYDAYYMARNAITTFRDVAARDPEQLPKLGAALLQLAPLLSPWDELEYAVEVAAVYRDLYERNQLREYREQAIHALDAVAAGWSGRGAHAEAAEARLAAESLRRKVDAERLEGRSSQLVDQRSTEGDPGQDSGDPPSEPPNFVIHDDGDDMDDRIKRLETLADKTYDRLGQIERDLATIKAKTDSLASEKDLSFLKAQASSFASETSLLKTAADIRKEMKSDLWILIGAIVSAAAAIIGVMLRQGIIK